jgi:hypothetical protein
VWCGVRLCVRLLLAVMIVVGTLSCGGGGGGGSDSPSPAAGTAPIQGDTPPDQGDDAPVFFCSWRRC